jgi:Uncharacterised nucleotidyltransferase
MTIPVTTPEIQLLLACARVQRSAEDDRRIRALACERLDWGMALDQAQEHCVVPLLYAGLRGAAHDAVPEATMALLRDLSLYGARHSLYLAAELARILARLDAGGIPAVPYKGPLLAVQAYGSVTLRQPGDLDILIRRQDFEQARDILFSEGYRSYHEHSSAEEQRYVADHHDYAFLRATDQVCVELQWAFSRLALGYEGVKDRLVQISLAGTVVPSISAEQLLIILCVHGSKHCWSRLQWICDVAELVRTHPSLDWPRLFEEAGRLGARRMLALGLLLARMLLDAELPVEALRCASICSAPRPESSTS